jgi:G3E family GTPase
LARQIASADIIILNKADIAKAPTLESLKVRVKDVNPHAPLYQTTGGVIDVGKIIGLDAFRSRSSLLSSDFAQDNHDHDNSNGEHHHTEHFHQIHPLHLSLPQLAEEQHSKLDEWIRSVLWESQLPQVAGESTRESAKEEAIEVLRTKGMFSTPSGWFMLQGVRELYEITPLPSDSERVESDSVSGKLVLIGKGLGSKVRDNFITFIGL